MTKKQSAQAFANTITELSLAEVAYSDDFFATTLKQQAGRDATTADVLKEYVDTQPESPHLISATGDDTQVDEHWLQAGLGSGVELAVDVIETEDALIVRAIAPGVRSADLDITVQGELLTIEGKRPPEAYELPAEAYLIRECVLGHFSRSIILPHDIMHDRVTATLEQGLLTVVLPKSQSQRHAKIEVVDVSGA